MQVHVVPPCWFNEVILSVGVLFCNALIACVYRSLFCSLRIQIGDPGREAFPDSGCASGFGRIMQVQHINVTTQPRVEQFAKLSVAD